MQPCLQLLLPLPLLLQLVPARRRCPRHCPIPPPHATAPFLGCPVAPWFRPRTPTRGSSPPGQQPARVGHERNVGRYIRKRKHVLASSFGCDACEAGQRPGAHQDHPLGEGRHPTRAAAPRRRQARGAGRCHPPLLQRAPRHPKRAVRPPCQARQASAGKRTSEQDGQRRRADTQQREGQHNQHNRGKTAQQRGDSTTDGQRRHQGSGPPLQRAPQC